MLERSVEFLEGYNSTRPRIRNPYDAGQPWLAEHIDKEIMRKSRDWLEGWQIRFHNEPI